MNIVKNKLILVKEQEFEYKEKIRCMEDLIDFIRDVIKIEQEPEEVLYLITLSNANQIHSFMEVARGTINCCNFHEADIYKRVLLSNCRKFILVHNHPSGIAKPSLDDRKVTDDMKKSSKLLGLNFLDHIVIGDNCYTSCFE
mgnify:FL=1